MKKIIHHLRKQPEETKRHILHLVTALFGIILLVLWVYSLGTNFSDASVKEQVRKDLEPFSVLKNNITFPSW